MLTSSMRGPDHPKAVTRRKALFAASLAQVALSPHFQGPLPDDAPGATGSMGIACFAPELSKSRLTPSATVCHRLPPIDEDIERLFRPRARRPEPPASLPPNSANQD